MHVSVSFGSFNRDISYIIIRVEAITNDNGNDNDEISNDTNPDYNGGTKHTLNVLNM